VNSKQQQSNNEKNENKDMIIEKPVQLEEEIPEVIPDDVMVPTSDHGTKALSEDKNENNNLEIEEKLESLKNESF